MKFKAALLSLLALSGCVVPFIDAADPEVTALDMRIGATPKGKGPYEQYKLVPQGMFVECGVMVDGVAQLKQFGAIRVTSGTRAGLGLILEELQKLQGSRESALASSAGGVVQATFNVDGTQGQINESIVTLLKGDSESAVGITILAGLTVSVLGRLAILPVATLDTSRYPVEACHWLRTTQPPGSRVLVSFNDGSFALWRLYPNALVSMDGRFEEVYLPQTFELNAHALNEPEERGQKALELFDPTHILVNKDEVALTLSTRPYGDTWIELYEDAKFKVLGVKGRSLEASPKNDRAPSLWMPLF